MTKEIHGHEVLHMMEGHDYTKETLRQAIVGKFGANQLFYTCCAEHLNVDQLIDFLEERNKFKPAAHDQFTVNAARICNH